MKIYLAGAPGGGSMGDCRRERELNKLWKRRLWSFFHLNENTKKKIKK